MENGLRFVDVFNKAFDAARIRKVFAFTGALIHQFDLDTVVKEREFANAFGQNFKVILDVNESFHRSHKVHFGATTVARFTRNLER